MRVASAFEIRLPEGEWVAQSEMTTARLVRHGEEIAAIGGRDSAFWHPAFSVGALSGRHRSLRFDLDADGRASAVAPSPRGWTFDAVLRTPDGRHVFGFPIAARDLETPFGPASRVQRTPIVTGFSCL